MAMKGLRYFDKIAFKGGWRRDDIPKSYHIANYGSDENPVFVSFRSSGYAEKRVFVSSVSSG